MGQDVVEGVGHSDQELGAVLADVAPENRPAVTPVQYTVVVGAVVQFARAFGIFDVSQEQEEALNVACGMLVSLGLGDVVLRGFRNLAAR